MFATTTRFAVPAGRNWDDLRHVLVARAFHTWDNVAGLRSAAARREFGGNHVWETAEHAEAFFRSPRWQRVVEEYGEPRIERAEVCAYVESRSVIYPKDFDSRLEAAH
jgi:ribonuclease HI